MFGDMRQTNTDVQITEHLLPIDGSDHPQLCWDDLRHFLAIADAGSFRAAALELGISTNSMRKRIKDLEHSLNCILVTRSPTGIELTVDGRAVYSVAIEIRDRVNLLDLFAAKRGATSEGVVRLAITEGLGTFWVMPKLSSFTERFPKIRIDLRCEMRIPDISKLETDITVQLDAPRDPALIVRKIATLHLLFFATRDYLDRRGVPKTVDDLGDHTLVHLVADQIPSHLLQEKVKIDPQFRFVRVLTNTSSSQVMAIAEGAGLGVLPSYAAALSRRLVPTGTDFYLKRPVWLVYHPEAIKLRRVRYVVDWLIEAFDPKKYPWFRDEFVPPECFAPDIDQTSLFRKSLNWTLPERSEE